MSKRADEINQLFATTSLGAPEKAVGFVLWRVVHRYMREVDRALDPLNLTHLQFTTLAMAAWLGRTDEDVTQSNLADYSDIHPMQVSQMLKILEGKKFVRRPRSTVDVRAKRIEVTAGGLAALRRALPIVIAVQKRLFGEEGKPGGRLLATLVHLESTGL
jgi:DNA-binding MarR family transcriptional regulator